MPVIPNARKEHFSRLLAKGGITQLEAYIQAGYSEKSGQSAASVLANDPMILNRVQELKERELDRGLIPEKELDLDGIVEADAITEDWLILQYQDLIRNSKQLGALKVARDCLLDIAAIKGIGKANQQNAKDTNDKLPSPTTFNISLALERLSENRESLNNILENAIDITSKVGIVPDLSDEYDTEGEPIDGDPVDGRDDGERI